VEYIGFYCSDKLHKDMKDIAKYHKTSISSICRSLLWEYVKKERKEIILNIGRKISNIGININE